MATGAATAPARIAAVTFTVADLHEALEVVRQFDPQGIACRDLRECLLYQLRYHLEQLQLHRNGSALTEQVVRDAIAVVDQHLKAVTLKQFKEIARAIGRPIEAVQAALEYVRTLDPRPGLRYNKVPARLIEPDVAFVKHGDEWLVIMNDEDMPQLRLNPAYKRLLTRDGNDRDTRNYVKDRYKSAIQLIKNIEQRKQTITKVCYSIVARQQDFLERGIDLLKPMMIKEVAEEIGVHPSTVSRAVANKYVHTPQGVFELTIFLLRERARARGRRHFAPDFETPRQEADRRRRSKPSVDRRTDHPHSAIAGYPGHSPNRREISGRYEDSQHAPKKSKEVIGSSDHRVIGPSKVKGL